MSNVLDKRLAKLEAGDGGEIVVLWQNYKETAEQAEARWIQAHPGRDLNKAGTRVYIISWSYPDDVAGQSA